MRLLKIFINNMPRFKENIDIDFITKQRVAEMIRKNYLMFFLIITPNFILTKQFHL